MESNTSDPSWPFSDLWVRGDDPHTNMEHIIAHPRPLIPREVINPAFFQYSPQPSFVATGYESTLAGDSWLQDETLPRMNPVTPAEGIDISTKNFHPPHDHQEACPSLQPSMPTSGPSPNKRRTNKQSKAANGR
jgi:hypothetical protein